MQLASSPDPVDYYLLGNADAQASYMNGAVAAYEKCADYRTAGYPVQGSRGSREERNGIGNEVEQGLSWRTMAFTEIAELESILGHQFRDPRWLLQALMHSSRIPERSAEEPAESNEKLEFLGDAVLELIVSEELVREFPDWSEGQLSKSRARLVNATAISLSAQRLGFGQVFAPRPRRRENRRTNEAGASGGCLRSLDRGDLSGWRAGSGARIRAALPRGGRDRGGGRAHGPHRP